MPDEEGLMLILPTPMVLRLYTQEGEEERREERGKGRREERGEERRGVYRGERERGREK